MVKGGFVDNGRWARAHGPNTFLRLFSSKMQFPIENFLLVLRGPTFFKFAFEYVEKGVQGCKATMLLHNRGEK